ncbi:MAG: 7,8-didemethyl-8-hydroxy-5-deazariboflavin synthase CofG, partial [Pseudomonadales bacterium]
MNARLPTPLPAPGLSEEDAFGLLERPDLSEMMAEARALRDDGFGALLTYSKKLFIPLTHLCRDVCHYCTFATTPRHQQAPYMSIDAVLEAARQGAAAGCKEALFTLGEKPELRYRAAREALETLGFPSTTAYLAHVAERVLAETGLLPHLNPGTLSDEEFRALKPAGPSMGMMLESTSLRLCEKGMPHYGSPDKDPAVRLATLDAAGRAAVPFTTGLLIGIGETRRERIETLLAIRASHAR